MIILVEPKYNPDLQGRITSSTQLGPGITCAKFLGALGSRTQFEKLYSKGFSGSANRNQIARNLVPHSHAMQVFYSNPLFAQHRLTVSDGIYEPNPKFQVTESWSHKEYRMLHMVKDRMGGLRGFRSMWVNPPVRTVLMT